MVYLIVDENKTFCKIGHTKDVKERLTQLQDGNPLKLFVLCAMEGDKQVETEVHQMFSHLHKRGEWFLFIDEIYSYFKDNKIEGFTPYSKSTNLTFKQKSNSYSELFEEITFPACASAIDEQIMSLINKSENTARKIRQKWEKENKIIPTKEGKEIIYTKH